MASWNTPDISVSLRCPFKFKSEPNNQLNTQVSKTQNEHEATQCEGNKCAWFIKMQGSIIEANIGECAVRKLAKSMDSTYDLLLHRI